MNPRYLVSRSRYIAAAPEAIFEVLATPALHSVIDGSDTVKGTQPRGPRTAVPRRQVRHANEHAGELQDPQHRLRIRGRPPDRVAALLRPRVALPAGTVHGPDGTPGTLVTEQWDARQVRGKSFLRLAGYLRRHPANLEQTLAKLDAYMAAHPDMGNVDGSTKRD